MVPHGVRREGARYRVLWSDVGGGRPRPRPAAWPACQQADEDSPPFVNVFFELFFELGRDLFDMGTLSPYPWDLPRSGQQYGWWDSRNCPTLSALESALGSHPLRCPILCPSISSLTLLGAIISSPRPQQRCRAWPDRTTC